MRIKHKHTGETIGGTYNYWKNKVLSNNIEMNYEILTKPNLVDVFEINHSNGKLKFIDTIDRSFANNKYLKKEKATDIDKYTIKDADLSKFDEYYRLKNQSELSFFERIKKIWNSIPRPKTIYERITNSTISKFTSNIITTVIGGLLILIIWTVYKTKLIELWNSYLG